MSSYNLGAFSCQCLTSGNFSVEQVAVLDRNLTGDLVQHEALLGDLVADELGVPHLVVDVGVDRFHLKRFGFNVIQAFYWWPNLMMGSGGRGLEIRIKGPEFISLSFFSSFDSSALQKLI